MLSAVRVDVLLFSVAIMVVAAHAAVDSFIAPEPGTGWGDHLLRGFTTFAVLILAAVAYPAPAPNAHRSYRAHARTPRSRTPTTLYRAHARAREAPTRSHSGSSEASGNDERNLTQV